MAHELTMRQDNFAEMAFVGQTPWHGLGQELDQSAGLDEWQVSAGLDWTIEKAPVMFEAEGDNPHHNHSKFAGQNVLYRSDTKAPLSVVSDKYKVVQPKEVLHFFKDLVEGSGYKLHTAGSLRGGSRIWALAETGKMADVAVNDTVMGYLLLATSCDKAMATTARFTSVRVVCANTLGAAERDKHSMVSVPHSTQFNAKRVHSELGIAVSNFDLFMSQAKELSARKATDKRVDTFLKGLLIPQMTPNAEGKYDLTRNRSYKRILELFEGDGMGSELKGSRGTMWGLLNAVTEFTDHHNPSRTDDGRLNSAWFGRGDTFKNDAFALALAA